MNAIDDIAKGAWSRLRNLIGALDRVDRLDTPSEFAGWLQDLAGDEAELEATIREFLLRALGLASDPINSRILTSLDHSGATGIHDLLKVTGLTRIELVERTNDLARAGLTVQALEGDQVEVTALARGFISLMEEISARIKAQAHNDNLLNPRAAMLKPAPPHERSLNPNSQRDLPSEI